MSDAADFHKWKKFTDGIVSAAENAGIKPEEFMVYLLDFTNHMLKCSGRKWSDVIFIKDQASAAVTKDEK